MRWTRVAGFWAASLLVSAAVAGTSGRWLHVVVDEGPGGETVKMHLPLNVVESVLPLVNDEHLSGGKVRVGDAAVEVPDLQRAWQELRGAPDGDFLTVRGGEGRVRVGKAQGSFLIHVDEPGEDGERVEVRLPLAAVDALFSGKPGELDVLAALHALGEGDAGDIVRVTGGADSIRIWVDSRQGARQGE